MIFWSSNFRFNLGINCRFVHLFLRQTLSIKGLPPISGSLNSHRSKFSSPKLFCAVPCCPFVNLLWRSLSNLKEYYAGDTSFFRVFRSKIHKREFSEMEKKKTWGGAVNTTARISRELEFVSLHFQFVSWKTGNNNRNRASNLEEIVEMSKMDEQNVEYDFKNDPL